MRPDRPTASWPRPRAVVHDARDAGAGGRRTGKAVAVVAQDDDGVSREVAALVQEAVSGCRETSDAAAAEASRAGRREARSERCQNPDRCRPRRRDWRAMPEELERDPGIALSPPANEPRRLGLRRGRGGPPRLAAARPRRGSDGSPRDPAAPPDSRRASSGGENRLRRPRVGSRHVAARRKSQASDVSARSSRASGSLRRPGAGPGSRAVRAQSAGESSDEPEDEGSSSAVDFSPPVTSRGPGPQGPLLPPFLPL